ncbi:hypothetical protein BDR26DRAFT_868277, partial [Obelidium mucronatum]
MNLKSIVLAVAANVGINTIGFIISAAKQTEHYYDLCGTGSFIASAIVALVSHGGMASTRQLLQLATTTAWALRLLVHLVGRVHRLGADSRFDGVKTNAPLFAVYWAVQALWVAVVCFPTVAVCAEDAENLPALGWRDAAALAVWTAGFVFEVVADRQKAVWQGRHGKQRVTNFISTGVWAWCRYPNYFGEITLWVGSYLLAINAFPDSSLAKYGFTVSPLFITFILTRLSGIPLQEAQAKKRFKGNDAYAKYVKETNLLVPWPFSRINKNA